MTMLGTRPRSLRDVVHRASRGEQQFDAALREFLDSFYSHPDSRTVALMEQPEAIDPVHDAYVAAVAEHLANVFGLPVPAWTDTHGNGLKEPFFAGGLESLKAILQAESPAAFRRRLLFVSKDVLSRPRLQSAGKEREAAPHGSSSVSQ
jgi:hypothetical protein